MSDQEVIATNLTSEICEISDLGHIIKEDATSIISEQFEFVDICESDDLKNLINNDILSINDLSKSDAIDYLSLPQECNTPSTKIVDGVLYYPDTTRG